MDRFPASDLKQRTGDVLAAAARGPVTITKHNKPRFVVMTVEAYEARHAPPPDPRRAYRVDELPHDLAALLEADLLRQNAEIRGDGRGGEP